MKIATKRLIVRKVRDTDWEDMYEYLSVSSIYEYEPGKPVDAVKCRELISNRAAGDSFYAIELINGGKVIGHLYFNQIDSPEILTWELGYITNPIYQRKGYTSEASEALIEYAMTKLGIHRIVAECNPENIASWKLLEKIGMSREEHLIQNIFFKKDLKGNPIWQDTYLYAITKV